jgi:hypothetical protein
MKNGSHSCYIAIAQTMSTVTYRDGLIPTGRIRANSKSHMTGNHLHSTRKNQVNFKLSTTPHFVYPVDVSVSFSISLYFPQHISFHVYRLRRNVRYIYHKQKVSDMGNAVVMQQVCSSVHLPRNSSSRQALAYRGT